MFESWKKKEEISDEEIRLTAVNAVTLGGLILAIKDHDLSLAQSAIIVEYSSQKMGRNDLDGIAYHLSDHMAEMHEKFTIENMCGIFNQGRDFPKAVKEEILFLCFTIACLCDRYRKNEIGRALYYAHNMSYSPKKSMKLLDLAEKNAALCLIKNYNADQINAHRILQKTVKRIRLMF